MAIETCNYNTVYNRKKKLLFENLQYLCVTSFVTFGFDHSLYYGSEAPVLLILRCGTQAMLYSDSQTQSR